MFPGFGLGSTPLGPLKGFGGGGLFGGDDDKGEALKLLLEQMQRAQNLGNVKAEGYGVRGLRDLLGGYDAAIGNVARTGAASRSAAIGAGQRAGAAAGQSLAGRGLYNTSALDAAKAMNTGATSQALANIDQSLAAAKGGLQAQRGQASQAGHAALGALAERNAQAQMGPLGLAFQQTANAPSQFDQLMQLFQGAGSLLPFFGGFGGGKQPGGMGFAGITQRG